MKIGLDGGALNERGMTVAIYDYAAGLQDQLGHEAVVFYNPDHSLPDVLAKFTARFPVVAKPGHGQDEKAIEREKLDFYYILKDGLGSVAPGLAERTGVHAVFRCYKPHGDVYAYVSEWLTAWMTGGRAPFVPHIVDLPDPNHTLRDQLRIPADAFVVGRYGGFDQFNLEPARRAVARALNERRDLYLLFVNTQPFLSHDRALFLSPVVGLQEKSNFIATCDAGLNAKKIGESFGLANAEFYALGKPVFTWAGGMDQNHVWMTPDDTWLYRTENDLYRLLTGFSARDADADLAISAAQTYSPTAVMKQFDQVFLSGRYAASDIQLSRAFRLKRRLQEKWLRAKFRAWKMV
ncbi:hypothetical protein GCM10011316_05030 [Roseibium aquae]|uniref:Uncharacterized protein n=1 Tax=Roseibium aquae TaxID=1323746 RepID=A0A916WUU6_9HYPH|nr:glycosyltransferase family 4 protein [Roseibium aquae]GGB35883.1 hypothetical protein GCM10011316_05030 [Roseibium aquae]